MLFRSQYIRIYDGTTTYVRWQNYYVNQTIQWESQSWNFFPFTVNGIISGPTQNDLSITVPVTNSAAVLFNTAMSNNYLCEFKMYEFDSRLTQTSPQNSQTLIAAYVGEVIGINGSFTEWTITVGSSLASVGAQVPPRKYTNILVGTPIRI